MITLQLELLERVDQNLPKGFQPYEIYSILVNQVEVGRLVLREGTDEERYFDGHIGYTIEEAYQGHHYAYQACLLLKVRIKKDHVIMTCDPHNMASLKTIEKLGCQYLETKVIPSHLKKYFTKKEKEKRIYQWNIK